MAELGLEFKGAYLKAPFFVTQKVLMRENREKKRKEKNLRKIKSRFKLNKLIVYSNLFNLFFSII